MVGLCFLRCGNDYPHVLSKSIRTIQNVVVVVVQANDFTDACNYIRYFIFNLFIYIYVLSKNIKKTSHNFLQPVFGGPIFPFLGNQPSTVVLFLRPLRSTHANAKACSLRAQLITVGATFGQCIAQWGELSWHRGGILPS